MNELPEILEVDIPHFEYKNESELRQSWPDKKRESAFGVIPYGYEMKGGDPKSLVPNMAHVILIEQALDSLERGSSLRETALLLSEQSGVSISHVGLSKIWQRLRGGSASARAERNKEHVSQRQPKNREEKKQKQINIKAGAEKRRITAAQKRLRALQEAQAKEAPPVFSYVEMEALPEDVTEEKIAFKPNEGPQTEFLAAPEQEVLYGGAAGGGKSYALLADFLRYADNQNSRGLLLRRTNDELRELKDKAYALYKSIYGDRAKWHEQKSEWTFPSGAKLWITYLERDQDALRYQGQSFTWIAFDELTQYPTPFAWDYLRTRLRTTDESIDLCQRGTTNPGGPGHGWVKRYFIDPAPPNHPFIPKNAEDQPIVFPKGHKQEGEPMFLRRFIPAKLSDNPHLYNDGKYEANLLSQGENARRQLLEGDWTIAEGAAFPEFRMHIHTCEPFTIPADWRRFRSCDYGYSSFSAVHWYAIDPSYDTLYVYRELYVTKKTGADLAPLVLQAEQGEHISYGMLDSSCWHVRGATGPTIAEEMIGRGCRWRPSDRGPQSRINGRQRLHQLLKVDDVTGRPGIIFFNTCRQIIADLPVIPTDPEGTDDIDSRYKSDHAYDSIRYGIQSRPRAADPFQGIDFSPGARMSDMRFGY